jgi:hypothetical protein
MSKITTYTALTTVAASDALPVVDISDTTMAASGTTKKVTAAALMAAGGALVVTDPAYAGGAKGDGTTDDTAALTAWVGAINAAAAGVNAVLPAGQYLISSSLPAITTPAVTIAGAGWAQSNNTIGSCIVAATALTGTMLTLSGEGIELRRLTVDGRNHPSVLVASTANHVKIVDCYLRGVAASGVGLDVQTGGTSNWVDRSVVSCLSASSTCIQVNDTDIQIINCKPQNAAYNVVLLNGASGAVIANNHMTPGATNGVNCIWLNGNPNHVIINGNRFDNFVQSAIQSTPAANPFSTQITNNKFMSTVMTDNTFALIGVDYTNGGVRGLHISGNTGYSNATNRPKYFYAPQTQAGATSTNTGRTSTHGTLVNANSAWLVTSFFNGNPLVARGNMITTDGTTYTAVTDV